MLGSMQELMEVQAVQLHQSIFTCQCHLPKTKKLYDVFLLLGNEFIEYGYSEINLN